jgi:hypothetical protein
MSEEQRIQSALNISIDRLKDVNAKNKYKEKLFDYKISFIYSLGRIIKNIDIKAGNGTSYCAWLKWHNR